MSKKRLLLAALVVGLGALAFIAFACGDNGDDDNGTSADATEENGEEEPDSRGSVLADVLARDELVCGVNDGVPGFGFVESDQSNSGFDVEFCKAVAAAVLGDATKVSFVPLSAEARLPAVQTGEVDVLIRNTTWTLSRDAASGLSFATTTYYDGQGMMVPVDGAYASMDELEAAGESARICVLTGTTTELNIADRLPDATAVGLADNDTIQTSIIEGACDAWTSDKSQLAARRSEFPDDAGGPEALVLLDEVFSKEPLGPVTIDNDDEWFDIVNWTVIGMILADEKGITSENIDEFIADPGDPETARFLGVPGEEGAEVFDGGLAVSPDFMQEVIRQVGNYNEVYERTVLAVTEIPREGTENARWTEGGLIYSPPWR